MADLKAGYIGIAQLESGLKIRCIDFNVNPQQDALFYNHAIGLNDTVPTNSSTKGEVVGTIQTQRRIWRPSPIALSGGMSFPATEGNLQEMFDHMKYGTYFNLDFEYYCETQRKFTNCRLNSYNFSITAGDIINTTVDLQALDVEDNTGHIGNSDPEKLITWDKVEISISGDSGIDNSYIQGLDINVNNNLTPIYTANPGTAMDNLLPYDLRLGMQEVTGNLTLFLKEGREYIPTTLTDAIVISITAPSFTTDVNVVLRPRDLNGAIGPIVTSIPFVGVDKAFGE